MRYSPFLSCRQAAHLITARLDRPLGPLERLGLTLHLRICDVCPTVIAQFDVMRRTMAGWRDALENERG